MTPRLQDANTGRKGRADRPPRIRPGAATPRALRRTGHTDRKSPGLATKDDPHHRKVR